MTSRRLVGTAVCWAPIALAVSSLVAGWRGVVGVGAMGTVILGIVLLGEPATAARLISVGLILAGVVGLKLAAPAIQP